MNNLPFARTLSFALAAVAFSLSLVGCRGSVEVPRMGYVPMSVKLRTDGDDKLTRVFQSDDAVLSRYATIVIEPVAVPSAADIDCTDEELQSIRTKLQENLAKEFGPGAGGTGPTLVVRAAITAVKPNRPALNIAPQSQMMKRGYGYGACEIYATQGDRGPVVAAMASTVDTERFSAEKLSAMGTVDRGCEQWAKTFADLFR